MTGDMKKTSGGHCFVPGAVSQVASGKGMDDQGHKKSLFTSLDF
jgi:hypothetical protein